jgi:hypothetical protein
MGVYPFMNGSLKDFEPIVERLIKVKPNLHLSR